MPKPCWFYDTQRHPASAAFAVRHRSCAESFAHTLAWLSSLLTCIFAGVAYYFGIGASDFPLALSVIAGVMWIAVSLAGEWAMANSKPLLSYVYVVTLYALWVALIWCAAMCKSHIPAGQEFIEENWYILQTEVVIPFTTQLEQKAQFELFSNMCFWLGLACALLNTHPLQEGWAGLGGTLRLVQTRLGVLLPEVLPLLMCAAAAFTYDEYAIVTCPWATPFSTAALVAQSAAGGLAILVLVAVVAAGCTWDVGFLLHAAVALAFPPLALVTTVTSCLTLSRSGTVYAFVGGNWDTLKQFVPPGYQHQPFDKYAADSYTPMAQAGVSGLLLSSLLWAGALLHYRCAAIQVSVGPELWGLQVAAEADREARRRAAAALAQCQAGGEGEGAASPSTTSGGSVGYGVGGGYDQPEAVEVTWDTAREWLRRVLTGKTSGRAPSYSYNNNSISSSGSGYSFGASSPTGSGVYSGAYADPPPGVKSEGSSAMLDVPFGVSTASSADMGESPPGTPTVTGGAAFRDSEGATFRAAAYIRSIEGGSPARPPAAYGAVASPSPSSLSLLLTSGGAASESFLGHGGPPGQGVYASSYGVSGSGLSLTRAYFSYLGPRIEEVGLEAAAVPPTCGRFLRAVRVEGTAAWVAHRACILGAALACLVALGGMGGGLGVLELKGRCGLLAREAATVTYAKNFSLYDANRHVIYVTNEYPFGSVEVVATHLDSRVNLFTVEATSWAPSPELLLSFADFNVSANISDFQTFPGDDDTFNGFTQVHLVFRPPPGAEASCLGLRLRISSVFYAQYVIVSGRGMVNVTGDLAEISDGVYTSKTFTSLNVTSGAGAVVVTNLHVEPADLIDPAVVVPSGLSITSATGDVTLKGIFATHPEVVTGGTIRSSNVVSTAPLLGCRTTDAASGKIVPAVCGDLRYTVTGSGRISVSQGLAGDNVYLSTEHGEIVAANVAVVSGHDVRLSSLDGDMFLSTFIQAAGNQTFVSTAGNVVATALFVNRGFFELSGDAKLTVFEVFIGLQPPGILVVPNVTASIPLGSPLLYVRTDRGDIAVSGAGGNTGASYAGLLSMDIASNLGNIKLEVSGGGFVGNYTAVSDRGTITVEVDGAVAPVKGVLGTTPSAFGTTSGSGVNYLRLYTEGGDIQLAQLPSLI